MRLRLVPFGFPQPNALLTAEGGRGIKVGSIESTGLVFIPHTSSWETQNVKQTKIPHIIRASVQTWLFQVGVDLVSHLQPTLILVIIAGYRHVSRSAVLAAGLWSVPAYCSRPHPLLPWTVCISSAVQLSGTSGHTTPSTPRLTRSNHYSLHFKRGAKVI